MSRTSFSSGSRILTRGQSRKVLPLINGLSQIDENLSSSILNVDNSVCSTPIQRRLLRLQQTLDDPYSNSIEVEDDTSPTLAKLRITPGRNVKETQQILIDKHNSLKKNLNNFNVGGGVSLWPAMDRMRLTQREIIQLVFSAAVLFVGVVALFFKMHGSTLAFLSQFTQRLRVFWTQHPVHISGSSLTFTKSLLAWHSSYRTLLDEIQHTFDVSRCSYLYQTSLLCYLLGLSLLVYYLVDNMFSKSRLSPRRIKAWVCLLVVIGTWTLLMTYFLVLAHKLENAVEDNVNRLFEILADLVDSDYDLQQFNMILLYWRTRCLPPTTYGTLSILGILPVRSVAYYLQYYSLPVLTVLISPIVKLVSALCQVYRTSST